MHDSFPDQSCPVRVHEISTLSGQSSNHQSHCASWWLRRWLSMELEQVHCISIIVLGPLTSPCHAYSAKYTLKCTMLFWIRARSRESPKVVALSGPPLHSQLHGALGQQFINRIGRLRCWRKCPGDIWVKMFTCKTPLSFLKNNRPLKTAFCVLMKEWKTCKDHWTHV